METIGKKLKRMIKEKGFKTIKQFYDTLVDIFEDQAINRSTLTRTLKDRVDVRERTLNQFAIILGVKTSSLREGTNIEVSTETPSEQTYTYNKRAFLRIIEKKLPFAVHQLIMRRDGQTNEEQDNPALKESLKWIYVQMGNINVVINRHDGIETKSLHRSQCSSFDARQRHYFKNNGKGTAIALIIHHPAVNNTLMTS